MKSYLSDGTRIGNDIFHCHSPLRMHPWREVSWFLALPKTLYFEGMGVERKARRFFEPNVGEKRKVLYGFPIRNGLSNVLGGFNEIFLISGSAGGIFAGTVREGCISNDDRTLGVCSRVMVGTFGAL